MLKIGLNLFKSHALSFVILSGAFLDCLHGENQLKDSSDKSGVLNKSSYIQKGVSHDLEKIRTLTREQKWDQLSKYFKRMEGSRNLFEVQTIAEQEGCYPLQQAIDCIKAIRPDKKTMGISRDELFNTALFMETKFPIYFRKHKEHYKARRLGIKYDIKYDIGTNSRFIDLHKRIGKGTHKVVKTAILYQGANSKLVAQGVQNLDRRSEVDFTKRLAGLPGIIESKGYTETDQGREITIFYKYYNQGSLYTYLKKTPKIDLRQKVDIALGLITGLKSLHDNGVVHLDCTIKNCLINVKKDPKTGIKKIEAVIADLGCAKEVCECECVRAHGHATDTAPEAIFLHRMKYEDYLRTDIYGLGLVMYNLFYGKPAPWPCRWYIKELKVEEHIRYKKLVDKINYYTKKRRQFLDVKSRIKTLTPSEQFERLVLRMVHVDPEERGTASSLRRDLIHIFNRINQCY